MAGTAGGRHNPHQSVSGFQEDIPGLGPTRLTDQSVSAVAHGLESGRSSPVTKFLPMTGMVVSGLVGILFLADLAVKVPFRRVSVPLDVGFFLAALIVAYLSWSVLDTAKS